MRRVLVPLTLVKVDSDGLLEAGLQSEGSSSSSSSSSTDAIPGASWQLDTLAGVHHMSDRVVNGPRKQVEVFAARFRENEVIRCKGHV